MMKAIVCTEYGGPEKLQFQEVEDPICGSDQVLIKVKACSVNFPDTLIIQGLYQFKPEPPFIPGSDVSGVILEIGDNVENFKVGDEVIGIMPYGGYAEKACLMANMIMPKPAELSFEAASCLLYTYSTSFYALKYRGDLKREETLVVLGAAGGVGLSAVELGKSMGATVIAAASSNEKLELCKSYGADHTINYQEEDLKQRIKSLTNGKGADVVLDPVGGDYAEQALRATTWNGRYLVVGFTAGSIPKIPLNLVLLKSCQIVGVFLGAFAMKFPDQMDFLRMELLQLYKDGKINPHISEVFELSDAPEAIKYMMARKAMGKLVVSQI